MGWKLLVDCSPGIDDALALAVLLFDPSRETLAVTAVEGAVSAHRATCNVQRWMKLMDPPRWPRLGAATPLQIAPSTDVSFLLGSDGLAGLAASDVRLHHEHLSEKVLFDAISSAGDAVTLLTLGPLTNIWKVFQRDSDIVHRIGHLIIAGGSYSAAGDVTPTAELNIHYDPMSARSVFRSPCTKILFPLEVARRVPIYLNILDCLPADRSLRVDAIRKLITYYFRTVHQHFGWEHLVLTRTLAALFVLQPELFETRAWAGDVEVHGELTSGMTVFDRRHPAAWQANMEVVTDVKSVGAVREALYQRFDRIR